MANDLRLYLRKVSNATLSVYCTSECISRSLGHPTEADEDRAYAVLIYTYLPQPRI